MRQQIKSKLIFACKLIICCVPLWHIFVIFENISHVHVCHKNVLLLLCIQSFLVQFGVWCPFVHNDIRVYLAQIYRNKLKHGRLFVNNTTKAANIFFSCICSSNCILLASFYSMKLWVMIKKKRKCLLILIKFSYKWLQK